MNEQTKQMLASFKMLQIDVLKLTELLSSHDSFHWASDENRVHSVGLAHDKLIEQECERIGVDYNSVMRCMYADSYFKPNEWA